MGGGSFLTWESIFSFPKSWIQDFGGLTLTPRNNSTELTLWIAVPDRFFSGRQSKFTLTPFSNLKLRWSLNSPGLRWLGGQVLPLDQDVQGVLVVLVLILQVPPLIPEVPWVLEIQVVPGLRSLLLRYPAHRDLLSALSGHLNHVVALEVAKTKTVNLYSLCHAKVQTRNVNAFLSCINILPTFDSV